MSITTLDQKLQLWAENQFSDFPDFGSFSLINSVGNFSLRNLFPNPVKKPFFSAGAGHF